MGALSRRLRWELRARWRSWVGVAVLIGAAGAVVLTTAAGARRTQSAYPRFLRASHAADVLVSPNETGFPGYYRTLAEQTGAAVTPVIGFGATPVGRPGDPMLIAASPSRAWAHTVERPKITAGRLYRPDAPDEVVADTTAARMFGLHPGDRLELVVAGADEELPDPAVDPSVRVTVVGIGVTRDSVVAVNALASAPSLAAGPGFARRFGADHYAFDGAYVTLPHGLSAPTFRRRAETIAGRFPQTGGGVFVADESQQAAKVEHSLRPQATALWLFAGLSAVATLLTVGQVLARRVVTSSSEHPVLRALGMTGPQLLALRLAEATVIAVAGSLLAVGLAVLASPLMPIGPARVAEPDPGIAADPLVLGLGFVALVGALLAVAVLPAWRAAYRPTAASANRDRAPGRAGRLSGWALRAGWPPSTAIGLGHALGTDRRAAPARSAIAVTGLSVAALAASVTFATNLSTLVETPRLYGQAWDVTADAQFSPLPTATISSVLRHDPGVIGWTFGDHEDVTVDGTQVPTVGLAPAHGRLLAPTVVEGRAARSPDEIALGTKTLASLHRQVGDTVDARVESACCSGTGEPDRRVRVVGRSVFPFFGEGSFTPTGLGVGAQRAMTADGAPSAGRAANFVLVRVSAGPHHDADVAKVVADLGRRPICGPFDQCTVTTASRPADILNYARVRSTPVVLAVVFALLAMAVVANFLVTSTRRRRREFAVLETLGFVGRQVSGTVAWTATALVGFALVFGVPLGLVLGRWAWDTFAANLGIPSNTRTPLGDLLVAVPIALVAANLIAVTPGLLARRFRPAVALRTE